MYIRITGSRNSVPISRNACVPRRRRRLPQRVVVRHDHRPQADGDAEIGHQEQPHRREERARRRRPSRPGRATQRRRSAPSGSARAPATADWAMRTSAARCSRSASGVQMLTRQDRDEHADRQTRPIRRAQSCSSPSVLMISQPAPSSAIAEHQRDARQHRKRRQPVPGRCRRRRALRP